MNPQPHSVTAAMLLFCGLILAAPTGVSLAATTADHSKFEELDKDFSTGPEVTRACLSCHTEAASQIHKTKHWTWEYLNPATQQVLGKRHVLNNFCITPQTNFSFCSACHVGYGWEDENFDFTSEENVDCLVCHDTTGGYSKPPGSAGRPADFVKLKKVAQNVGKTSRDTCGACHFFGGGGDGVKHGDLDSSLAVPMEDLDVHMDALGLDFKCTTCHRGDNHDVAGSRYAPTAADTQGYHIKGKPDQGNPATCRACHDNAPHEMDRLNIHARVIACQTCHIPAMARGGVATKLSWDWSTAGKLNEKGKPLVVKNEEGHVIYHGKKGDFTYGENVIPEYKWFNGTVKYTLLGDEVDREKVTPINHFGGGPNDGESRIWPVKVFRGMQPYDPVNNTLVVPHTAGNDDTAYWSNFDWEKSIRTGMDVTNKPFSGEVDFIDTSMSWPITHMVAPAEKALECAECHNENGRLSKVEGIYMPAVNPKPWLDTIGWTVALLTLLGVLGHAAIRIFSHKR